MIKVERMYSPIYLRILESFHHHHFLNCDKELKISRDCSSEEGFMKYAHMMQFERVAEKLHSAQSLLTSPLYFLFLLLFSFPSVPLDLFGVNFFEDFIEKL